MATAKIILLQKSVNLLSKDSSFRNRWTSCSSLHKALTSRYCLEVVDISKKNISLAIGRTEPDASNLKVRNKSGIYSGTRNHQRYFWFQDEKKEPVHKKLPHLVCDRR